MYHPRKSDGISLMISLCRLTISAFVQHSDTILKGLCNQLKLIFIIFIIIIYYSFAKLYSFDFCSYQNVIKGKGEKNEKF